MLKILLIKYLYKINIKKMIINIENNMIKKLKITFDLIEIKLFVLNE